MNLYRGVVIDNLPVIRDLTKAWPTSCRSVIITQVEDGWVKGIRILVNGAYVDDFRFPIGDLHHGLKYGYYQFNLASTLNMIQNGGLLDD